MDGRPLSDANMLTCSQSDARGNARLRGHYVVLTTLMAVRKGGVASARGTQRSRKMRPAVDMTEPAAARMSSVPGITVDMPMNSRPARKPR